MKQLELLKKEASAYGGELLKTREGRSKPRPLDTKNTMHFVLRSTKARGQWSFKRDKNQRKIFKIIHKFASKYGVKIIAFANVGNHIHFHLKLTNRYTYNSFIRAVTSSIAMAIAGTSRWSKSEASTKNKNISMSLSQSGTKKVKFWDYRPYTRVVKGLKAIIKLKDYIRINELEGYGYKKDQARFLVAWSNIENKLNKPYKSDQKNSHGYFKNVYEDENNSLGCLASG